MGLNSTSNMADASESPVNVQLIDSHAVVRLATSHLIKAMLEAAIYEASTFEQAIIQLKIHVIDLIILDIELPGTHGLGMIGKIRELQPDSLILIFSGAQEHIYGLHYIRAGANGFLSKHSSVYEIQNAILSVMRHRRYASDRMQSIILDQTAHGRSTSNNVLATLSGRELEIIDMLIGGYWPKEIAVRFGLTESSISAYKSAIFEKLEVSTLIDLFKKVMVLKE